MIGLQTARLILLAISQGTCHESGTAGFLSSSLPPSLPHFILSLQILVADRAFLDLCWIGHDLTSRSIIQEAKLLLMCYRLVGPVMTAGFLDIQYFPIHAAVLETYKSSPKLLYTVGFPTRFLSALLSSRHASLQNFRSSVCPCSATSPTVQSSVSTPLASAQDFQVEGRLFYPKGARFRSH
jgi:hypothetical protein